MASCSMATHSQHTAIVEIPDAKSSGSYSTAKQCVEITSSYSMKLFAIVIMNKQHS